MIKFRYINKGDSTPALNIKKAEEKYNAIYIADLCLKVKDNYTEYPVSVFWNETPPDPNFSNYFGLYIVGQEIFICSAESVKGIWTGVESNDGEIIFSRYRHDFRTSRDGTVSIDGGRDYTRIIGNPKIVNLEIVGQDFMIIE